MQKADALKLHGDLQALQGEWEQIAFEADGVADALDDCGGTGAITTIANDRFVVRDAHGMLLLEGRFILDETVTPKAVTWIDAIGPDAGKHLPASYRLDGDSFEFIAADEGMPRPITFRTSAQQVMRSFTRRL